LQIADCRFEITQIVRFVNFVNLQSAIGNLQSF